MNRANSSNEERDLSNLLVMKNMNLARGEAFLQWDLRVRKDLSEYGSTGLGEQVQISTNPTLPSQWHIYSPTIWILSNSNCVTVRETMIGSLTLWFLEGDINS